MDLYLKVRLACSEGMSQREAAKHFNLSRDSIRKMLSFSVPPGYRRQAAVKRPKLDDFIGIIDSIRESDRTTPRKQRHTAKRIFERLKKEYGFTGGYTIVKDYVRDHERRHREMFVPLAHPPGHAQADFGEAMVVIGGVEQKAYFFAFDLPHSDAPYVRAYPGGGRRGVGGRPCARLCLLRQEALVDPLRQRSLPGGEDPARRHTQAGELVQFVPVPLCDRRPLWPARQGQRQGGRRGPCRL